MKRLALLLAPLLAVSASAQARPRPLVMLAWDGAADWVVDRLLAEGKMPNLARLARGGVAAEYSQPAFPSKTAVSFGAIYTGAYGDVNGITGNSVPLLPRAEHTILETRSGFDSRGLLMEPIYVTAAKAGRKVVVLSATQSHPAGPHLQSLLRANVPAGRYLQWSGFESSISGAKLYTAADAKPSGGNDTRAREVSLEVGDERLRALVYDDPKDPVSGLDTVRIIASSGTQVTTAELKPREAAEDVRAWSRPFRVAKGALFGNVYFRLFSLKPDGSELLLHQRAVNGLVGAATREQTEEYLEAYGGFHEDVFGPYEAGAFGPPIFRGGDGTAERRMIECVRLDFEFLKRGTRWALRRHRPDLLTNYSPNLDGAGHTWMGILDPESPAYDPLLAAKIMPFYEETYRLADGWLGDVMDAVGPRGAVAVFSDHGMAGIATYFNVNRVLQEAGLIAYTPEGQIDLSRTKACAPPWGDNLIVVNSTRWKGGIVAPTQKDEVLRAAERALLAARDPRSGAPVVLRVFRPADAVGIGLGGPTGGDLYLDLATGYYPSGRRASDIVTADALPLASGVHGFWPQRRKMHAIFYLGGAGVARGTIPAVRVVDIAPTLSRLMGFAPSSQATGHVVGSALAPKR